MTEAYKDSPEIDTGGSLAASLEVSLQQAYVAVGDVLSQGTLQQKIKAAQALGQIATGSTELLEVWRSVVTTDVDSPPIEAEATLPTHGVVLPPTVRIPVLEEPAEPLLHIVARPLEGLEETDAGGHILPLVAPTERENAVSDEVRPSEDKGIVPTAVPQVMPELMPAVSQPATESVPAAKVLEPKQTKVKQPSEALPVDEEGFTEKERLVLTYLQANSEREIRGPELVEHYMQHFPCANVRAGRQAVRKALRAIMAHPDYAGRLTTNHRNTVARRYTYVENQNTEKAPLASSAEVPAITESLLPPQDADDQDEHCAPGGVEASSQEQVEDVQLDVAPHPEENTTVLLAEADEVQTPTASNPNIVELFKKSVDISLLPDGFIPITQHGIGLVVDEEGRKTIYLKNTPHFIRGLALNIFEALISIDSGESEFIALKQSIEQKLGREISNKNLHIAISDLEKRLANNDSGFFNELRLIDKAHFRYVGIRGMLSSDQREEIQRFLVPGSDGLHQS